MRQIPTNLSERKRKLSLKEMTKVSNDYFEAHGYLAENHEKKITGVINRTYIHTSQITAKQTLVQ